MAKRAHLDILRKGAENRDAYSEKQRFDSPRNPDQREKVAFGNV